MARQFWFAHRSLQGARKLHTQLLNALMKGLFYDFCFFQIFELNFIENGQQRQCRFSIQHLLVVLFLDFQLILVNFIHFESV